MTPLLVMITLALAAPPARVVMPASGVVVDGLPTDVAARWEAEGTLVVGERDVKPIDRLLGWSANGERVVTIEVRHEQCPPLSPATTSPWPKLGYEGIRAPEPERRAVKSCKAPNLSLELRFPAGTDVDADALLTTADGWESTVAALHAAYGATHVDLIGALAARDKLSLEAAPDAPDGTLGRLGAPLALRSGVTIDRGGDQALWLVRDLGGHDVLTLLAPTAAGLAFQLLPFERRFTCDAAMTAALKSLPAAPPDTPSPRPPPGWQMARAVGAEGAAFCVAGSAGGLVAVGGARMPREVWMPLAASMLGRIGEVVAR